MIDSTFYWVHCLFSGSNEWENTPVSERYNLVTKAKVSEKKYRLQKRFSGALKLLGDGFVDSGETYGMRRDYIVSLNYFI